MVENEIIISLASNANVLYGLSNKGKLYIWNTSAHDWSPA